MKKRTTFRCAVFILFSVFSQITAAQAIFTEDFESGADPSWGLYRAGEEYVTAVPMANAPQPLTDGGSQVGHLQDIDGSYTGAAIALAGSVDLQNYSIEADVFCYVGQSPSAYTGIVFHADSAKTIYIKMVADFKPTNPRIRLYNNKIDMATFSYTFDKSFFAADIPGGIPTADGWHKMKVEAKVIDETKTGYWCYFDGQLLAGSPIYDTSAHRMSSGQFGVFSFQQDADGLAGYFDNIAVNPIEEEFVENFESGIADPSWGLYRAGEEYVTAVTMANAPQPLAEGGSYVGYLQDIDGSYTGAAIALSGSVDLQNYSIEADVYCYVGQSPSAYTGIVFHADSGKTIYIKMVADFKPANPRIRLYNNKIDMATFSYTFDKSFFAADIPGGIPAADGWHKMKVEARVIDDSKTGYWCYFDGQLLAGSPIYDTSAHRMSSGQFGVFSFQQDADGLAGYFDNIVCSPVEPVTSVEDFNNPVVVKDFHLLQNYPNPFNPETRIAYNLPAEAFVSLTVRDLLGRQVRVLEAADKQAGFYSVTWDGKDESGNAVASGIYLYTLKTNNIFESRKMVLLR